MKKTKVEWAVALVAAFLFFLATSFSQTPEAEPARQYLGVVKLLSAQEYDKAFAEARKLIEQAPQLEFTYGRLIEAAKGLKQSELAEIFFNDLLKQAPINPRAYYGLALINRGKGEYDKAIDSLQQCLTMLPEFTPAYRVLSDIYQRQKNLAVAKDYFSSITASNPVAYYGLGYVYSLQKQYSESLAALEQAPALYDPRRLKGHIWLIRGQYADALKIFQSLVLETKSKHEIERQVRAQHDLGSTYLNLGNYQPAIDELKEALQIAEDLGDISLQDRCLLNIGLAYQRQDNYPLALNYWLRGLPLARAIDDQQEVGTYLGNLGLIHQRLGNLPQAIDYYRQAIGITKAAADERAQATFLTNLGSIYTELGNYSLAKGCFTEAHNLAQNSESPDRESAVLAELANLYLAQKDYQAALSVQTEALQLARKVRSPVRTGNSLSSLAALHFRMSNWQAARQTYEELLAQGLEFRMPRLLWQAHSGLAAVYDQQRELQKAQYHYRQAIAAMEQIRALLGGAEEKAGFFQDKVEVYKKLIAVLLKPTGNGFEPRGAAEAFHIAERARARALADLLAESTASLDQTLSPDLQQRQQAIQRRTSELNAGLLKEKALPPEQQNKEQLAKLATALRQVDEELSAWMQEVKQRNPRYAELKYPEPVRLPQAQQLLDEQTLLLAYSLGEQSSYLFAISRQQYHVMPLPKAATLRGQVTTLLAALTSPNAASEKYRRLANDLYRKLIGPVDRRNLLTGKKHLIVVADDALQRLPFEALLQPVSNQYLVERVAISYAPSVSVLANLPQPRPAAGTAQQAFLAYADPVYDGQVTEKENPVLAAMTRAAGLGQQWKFARLQYSRHEVDEIAKLFAPQGAAVFAGALAREELVKTKPDLATYRVLHFSAHGLVNESLPRFSSIVLSLPVAGADKGQTTEDGLLSAYEIFNLKLNAELVTLSACETALGKEVKGEGLLSLVRAFMYAGTPSVLATLWQVDDRSSAKLMIDFYTNWQQLEQKEKPGLGFTKAEALRRAQRIAIKNGSAPYYWAPFVLIGRGN